MTTQPLRNLLRRLAERVGPVLTVSGAAAVVISLTLAWASLDNRATAAQRSAYRAQSSHDRLVEQNARDHREILEAIHDLDKKVSVLTVKMEASLHGKE